MQLKVLVALDDSPLSRKQAQYVGKALRGNSGAEITLYHVLEIPPALLEHGGAEDPAEERRIEFAREREYAEWESEHRREVEDKIFTPVQQILRDQNDFRDCVVRTKIETSRQRSPAWLIRQELEEGDYTTIVLGKKKSSLLQKLLGDSVTSDVVRQVEGRDVWIVE